VDATLVSQSSREIKRDVGPVLPGVCKTLNPQFLISEAFDGTSAVNCAEISFLEDGVEITDTTSEDNDGCATINVKQTPPPPAPTPPVAPIGKKADPVTSGTGHAGDVMEYVLTVANGESNLAYFTLRDIAGP